MQSLCYVILAVLFLAFVAACSEPAPAEVQRPSEPVAPAQSPQGDVKSIVDQKAAKSSVSTTDSPTPVITTSRQLKPADFQVTGITVEPSEVKPEEPVVITAKVTNVGEQPATYNLELVIDGKIEATKAINVAAGGEGTASFTVERKEPRTYTVRVANVSETFKVRGSAHVVKPPPEPQDATSMAEVAGFSIALSRTDRIGGMAVIHLAITKFAAGDTSLEGEPQTVRVVLRDDHENQYSANFILDLGGGPIQALPLAPIGFVYSQIVNISMPEPAPIVAISFNDQADIPLDKVQLIHPDFGQDDSSAVQIGLGETFSIGEYLTARVMSPIGTLTGWVAPVIVQNTEYNPQEIPLFAGVQFTDGTLQWADTQALIAGSGDSTVNAPMPIMDQIASGRIPQKLLLLINGRLVLIHLSIADFGLIPERIAFELKRGGLWHENISLVISRPGSSFGRTIVWGGANLSWSPDGTRIAFCTPGEYNSPLVVMTAGEFRVLDMSAPPCYKRSPQEWGQIRWSPDGSQIALELETPGNTIAVVDVGANTSPLAIEGSYPSWSPDGTRLAFERNGQIYVINIRDPEDVVSLGAGNNPSWSPDGTRIAYHKPFGYSGRSEIWLMHPDGSNGIKAGLASSTGNVIAWSPSSENFAVPIWRSPNLGNPVIYSVRDRTHTVIRSQDGSHMDLVKK